MSLNHNPASRAIRKLSHPRLAPGAIATIALCILACIDPVTPVDEQDLGALDMPRDASSPLDDMDPSARVLLRSCTAEAPSPVAPSEPWRGLTSPLVARGEPSHALHDVVTTRSRDVDILGHVTYGLFERELAGEFVDLYIHDCDDGFALLSRSVTRSDGAVQFIIAREDVPFHGEYTLLMRVVGDGSTARATLHVLPEETRFVVYDVDEVLSTDRLSGFQDRISDFFEPVGLGEYTPEVREGAAETTRLRASQGYQILYLTPRPHELTGTTRTWLAEHDFAPGTLWFADEATSLIGASITTYKRAVLQRLTQRGYRFDAVYGATSEDFTAFQQANIPADVTFGVGEEVPPAGVIELGQSYESHNAALDGSRAIIQPYEVR